MVAAAGYVRLEHPGQLVINWRNYSQVHFFFIAGSDSHDTGPALYRRAHYGLFLDTAPFHECLTVGHHDCYLLVAAYAESTGAALG